LSLYIINNLVGYQKKEKKIYYFVGQAIIGFHDEKNHESFRWTTSLLIETGNVKQSEIIRAFGLSEISVKRYIKKYREAEGDPTKYFKPRNTRGAVVLTAEKIKEIEGYYAEGKTRTEAASLSGIKADTIKKGERAGKVKKKLHL